MEEIIYYSTFEALAVVVTGLAITWLARKLIASFLYTEIPRRESPERGVISVRKNMHGDILGTSRNVYSVLEECRSCSYIFRRINSDSWRIQTMDGATYMISNVEDSDWARSNKYVAENRIGIYITKTFGDITDLSIFLKDVPFVFMPDTKLYIGESIHHDTLMLNAPKPTTLEQLLINKGLHSPRKMASKRWSRSFFDKDGKSVSKFKVVGCAESAEARDKMAKKCFDIEFTY
jgi:hypothetical protein